MPRVNTQIEENREPLIGAPLLIDFDQAVKIENPKGTSVVTLPGGRRNMMLQTLLAPLVKTDEVYTIIWSEILDVEMLINMLKDFILHKSIVVGDMQFAKFVAKIIVSASMSSGSNQTACMRHSPGTR